MSNIIKFLGGPASLILIGALISAIGGIWAYRKQNNTQIALLGKNAEIANLSNKIAGLVSGGDSYCFLDFGTYNPVTNTFIFAIMHEGDFPIYDVEIVITDHQKKEQLGLDIKDYIDKDPMKFFHDLGKAQIHIQYKCLMAFREGSTTLSRSNPIQLPRYNDDIHKYDVSISARNGFFRQLIRLALVDRQWVSAKKLIREIDNKIIFEKVNYNFPKNDKSEVEW